MMSPQATTRSAWVRPGYWLGLALRLAGLLALTLLAAMPWGLPSEQRLILQLVPLAAVHACNATRPGSCPEWAAFAAGLVLDVLTQGPLGFWAFVYLIGYFVTVEGAFWMPLGVGSRLLQLIATLAIAAFVGWLISSLYYWQLADPRPWLSALPLTFVPAVLVCLVFGGWPRSELRRDNVRLERGA